MQSRVKATQLWSKSTEDLTKQLDELKNDLINLRVEKIARGASSKLTKMYASQLPAAKRAPGS